MALVPSRGTCHRSVIIKNIENFHNGMVPLVSGGFPRSAGMLPGSTAHAELQSGFCRMARLFAALKFFR